MTQDPRLESRVSRLADRMSNLEERLTELEQLTEFDPEEVNNLLGGQVQSLLEPYLSPDQIKFFLARFWASNSKEDGIALCRHYNLPDEIIQQIV
jgi:hypothetical protein